MRRKLFLLLYILLAVAMTLGVNSFAQTAAKEYGAREPATCPNRKSPITAATARMYVICDKEEYGANSLDLVSDVNVEVGAPRAYVHGQDSLLNDVDVRQLIYAIRGSYTLYSCISYRNLVSSVPPSTNCMRTSWANAQGRCWKNSFGEWHCLFPGTQVSTGLQWAAPPPPNN